jgi:N-acyl-D-amino-acid deacylase
MHDLIIRNANLVDGSAEPARHADIAIDRDRIVAVGDLSGKAHRSIDADGMLVTPGWVDIHTHYDGQATWDNDLTPSSWHGVTTSVFGNCGVGFAPVKPGSEAYLINLMEGVEDIPGSVLSEGLDFDWESFPEYLDVLERHGRTMDIGAQMPHGALRFYVMGERGADHSEVPTETEIARMGVLLQQALDAGAMGFTTSRTIKHRAADGSATPTLSASEAELFGLADAMRRAGSGVLECNSDLGEGDLDVLVEAARRAGRPLSVLLLQVDNAPGLWRETLDGIHAANAAGVKVTGQVGCRPIGIMMGLETTVHPFSQHPAWLALAKLSPQQRYATLCSDAALRQSLVTDIPDNAHTKWMDWALSRSFELGMPLQYEPDPSHSIAARAASAGSNKWQLALELMMAEDGHALLLYPFENYNAGNLEVIRTMLADEHTICGLGDAGAHVATICDASYPTFLLSHWARDRVRGEQLPLEFLVHKQSRATALSFGLADRGLIAPGYRADLNLIDFAALNLGRPHLAYDLPAGGKRFVQHAAGYQHTFVAGVEVSASGELTGNRPGRLLRGAQAAPNV